MPGTAERPDVTVCIPAYNAEDRIETAIRSILDQQVDADVEILVFNDGSTDRTAAIVAELAATEPSIRLIGERRNQGRPTARNRLVAGARGRFLTWLDADDVKYPTMLQAQLDTLAAIEAEEGSEGLPGLLVFTNFHWLWPQMDEPRVVEPKGSDDPMESLLDSSFGGYLWLMMGLTETFEAALPFDRQLPRLQDLGFFIRFAELGGRLVRVDTDEPLCLYLKDDQGRDAVQVWKAWCTIWRRYRHHFESYGLPNARRWRRHHYRVSRRFAAANHDRVTFWRIAFWELVFVIKGRFRRVIFDA